MSSTGSCLSSRAHQGLRLRFPPRPLLALCSGKPPEPGGPSPSPGISAAGAGQGETPAPGRCAGLRRARRLPAPRRAALWPPLLRLCEPEGVRDTTGPSQKEREPRVESCALPISSASGSRSVSRLPPPCCLLDLRQGIKCIYYALIKT